MKMISSTSTTSTSGVMLISDCRLVPLLISMNSVSLRCLGLGSGALGDQPDAVEAGLVDRDHGIADLADGEPRVAADHDLGVRFFARRGAEALAEILERDRLIVDPQPAGLVDRDQDLPPLVALLGRLLR